MTYGDKRLVRRAFWAVFLLELGFGVYLGFHDVLLGDAVSRTANAYYVLNVRPYRLASMGLVWNPLPSLLQLPFVWLAKFWRPLVTQGVGAACISALFAGWGAAILIRTLLKMKITKAWALMLALLFVFNPYIFFYGANGMSEMISIAFTLLIMCSLTLWMVRGKSAELVRIGVGFVGLFLTRYESIPFAAAVGLAILLHIIASKREKRYIQGGRGETWYYIEGTIVLTFLPMVYAILMWMLYNWVITGNPLYFLNSGYSMLAYSEYYADYGGPLQALAFLWARTWPFLILLAAVLLARLLAGRLLTMDTLIFCLTGLVLTVFQYGMLLNGSSAGYVRYMCYPLCIAAGWMPYELRPGKGRMRRGAALLIALALAVSGCFLGWALLHDEIYREDTLLMLPEGSRQMADYINSRLSGRRVLMDAYRSYYLFMLLDDPESVVISSSPDFYDCLLDPAAYGVEYILVPESGSYGDMDAVNIAFRQLYDQGAPWCQLEAEIGEFKLYKVTDSSWGGAGDEQ